MAFNFEKIKFRIVKKLKPKYELIGEIGDYFDNQIIAKDKKNKLENEMTLIHELLEYYLISKKGIKPKDIDKFDWFKNRDRKSKKYKLYRKAHRLCLKVEKLIKDYLYGRTEPHTTNR